MWRDIYKTRIFNSKQKRKGGSNTREPWMKNGGKMSAIRINKARVHLQVYKNPKNSIPYTEEATKKSLMLVTG